MKTCRLGQDLYGLSLKYELICLFVTFAVLKILCRVLGTKSQYIRSQLIVRNSNRPSHL